MKYNNNKSGFLYLIENGHNEYKIGKSKHPKKRLKELQTASPTKLKLIEFVECEYYHFVEIALHNYLNFCQMEGEHFKLPLEYVDSFFDICKSMEKNIKTNFEFNPINFDIF